MATRQRYIPQAQADKMQPELKSTFDAKRGCFESLDIVNMDTTEWYVVADDDPRILTEAPAISATTDDD